MKSLVIRHEFHSERFTEYFQEVYIGSEFVLKNWMTFRFANWLFVAVALFKNSVIIIHVQRFSSFQNGNDLIWLREWQSNTMTSNNLA